MKPGGPRRILVIDDDPAVRDLLELILRKEGFEVVPAPGGAEGLNLFDPTSIDVVITDLCMPGVDGVGVVRELRRIHPSTPILALSGDEQSLANEPALRTALLEGVSRSLAKPFVRADLLRVIEEMLREQEGEREA